MGIYTGTVWMRDNGIEKVDLSIREIECEKRFRRDGDNYGDGDDGDNGDFNRKRRAMKERSRRRNPPTPSALAQTSAHRPPVQAVQPIQQAVQRPSNVAGIRINPPQPNLAALPQSLSGCNFALSGSLSPLSQATLNFIISQHGGAVLPFDPANHHIDFVINGNDFCIDDLLLVERYGLEAMRQDEFIESLPPECVKGAIDGCFCRRRAGGKGPNVCG
jgi:hypothetical protein